MPLTAVFAEIRRIFFTSPRLRRNNFANRFADIPFYVETTGNFTKVTNAPMNFSFPKQRKFTRDFRFAKRFSALFLRFCFLHAETSRLYCAFVQIPHHKEAY